MRYKRPASVLALLCLVTISLFLIQRVNKAVDLPISEIPFLQQKEKPIRPPVTSKSHPIERLTSIASENLQHLKERQTRNLKEAIAEYRRRYRAPPPPHFDKWFELATRRRVQFTDEYDSIYHSLLPFWAVEPQVLRERTREITGFDNALIAVRIRDHQIVKMEGGGDGDAYLRDSIRHMTSSFIQYLPDMDLAFNWHDEPRVVIPHDDLSRYVQRATNISLPRAYNHHQLSNAWSPRPDDLGDGKSTKAYSTTRFNRFAHQATWSNSRMSCPPDSPSRSLAESVEDDRAAYAMEPLGFVANTTAFSDICNSPSLQRTYGFFDRPNSFDVSHDLFPIFSQSKVSSFQDILYPSPWYWVGKVGYQNWRDHYWTQKTNKMFWRGSTTGGFSRNGGWKRQHRQLFVGKINALDWASKLEHNGEPEPDGTWTQVDFPRHNISDKFDVRFSKVGQCDPGDCDAQKEHFDVAEYVAWQDAFNYKYLADVDGNAFSGRYYAFLLSRSLIYKLTIFREWHDEWLKPWVHYIPLSLHGDEYVESVRYFDEEEVGQVQAKEMATASREWAEQVLRKEDMEIWFFRLLLE